MKHLTTAMFVLAVPLPQAAPAQDDTMSNCEKLVALFVELADRSGETVTQAEAQAEVMSENPSEQECAAMLEMFAGQLGQL